jgi:hypothetical protein
MARPNQATKAKRDRERMRQERQQEKQEKRAQRSELKREREFLAADGVDPDLVGIVPGPQPLRDET